MEPVIRYYVKVEMMTFLPPPLPPQWLRRPQAACRPLQEEQAPQGLHLLRGLEPLWPAASHRLQRQVREGAALRSGDP